MTSPTCEHCGLAKRVMLPMEPGRDGQPWQLCVGCWDRRTAEEVAAAPVAPVREPVEERSAAKADVGSFERAAPKKKRARG